MTVRSNFKPHLAALVQWFVTLAGEAAAVEAALVMVLILLHQTDEALYRSGRAGYKPTPTKIRDRKF